MKHPYPNTCPNPSGLCLCGCGQKTTISRWSHKGTGRIKGCPRFYVVHHHLRSPLEEYKVVESGCWEWQRPTNERGYGRAYINGRGVRAHRYMYEKLKGPIPNGLVLDHLCGNPGCVNPDHLEPVTNAENLRRGRGAKLTMERAREIRALAGSMTRADIARRFGVSAHTVGDILRGTIWRE